MRRSSSDGLEMSGRSLNAEHLSLHRRTPECVQKVPLMIRARGLSSALLLLPLLSVTCGEETRFFIVQNQVPQEGCSIPGGRSANLPRRGAAGRHPGVGRRPRSPTTSIRCCRTTCPRSTSEGAPQPNRLSMKGFHVEVDAGGRCAGGRPSGVRRPSPPTPTLQGLLSYDEADLGDPGAGRQRWPAASGRSRPSWPAAC